MSDVSTQALAHAWAAAIECGLSDKDVQSLTLADAIRKLARPRPFNRLRRLFVALTT